MFKVVSRFTVFVSVLAASSAFAISKPCENAVASLENAVISNSLSAEDLLIEIAWTNGFSDREIYSPDFRAISPQIVEEAKKSIHQKYEKAWKNVRKACE